MADVWYLDYSAAKLSGTTIRNAGYRGTIRYIAAGRESKQTNLNEYRSHLAAGLDVWLVCQAGTSDADQGFARGAQLARAAKAEADALGYPSHRVIFFTNDRVELPSPAAWRAFLDGAASVLGRSRVGAYGFANAMDAAKGHAVAFWQAGRRSDVRAHVHFWQDNNTQVTVGGVLCDRNLVLKAIEEDDDMQLTDRVDWDKINGLGPNYLGHKILGTWQHARATRALATQTLAAVTSDADITPERLDAALDRSIAEHMPTAEEVAAAQRPFLADLIREVVPAEQADLIVDELVSRLANNPV